jgi:hypothetical protein
MDSDDDGRTEPAGDGEDVDQPEPTGPPARRVLRPINFTQWALRNLAILVLTGLGIYGLSLLPDAASLPIIGAVAAGYLVGLHVWRRR